MNALTKSFVVLVTILAVLMVALIVPYVAKQGDSAQAISDLQTKLKSTQEEAERKINLLEETKETFAAQVNALTSEVNDFTTDQERLAKANAELSSEKRALESQIDLEKVRANVSSQMVEAEQGRNETLNQQLAAAQETVLTQASKIADLNVAVTEASKTEAVMIANVQRLKEQLLAAEQSITEIASMVPRDSRPAPEPVVGDIEGQVTSVTEDRGLTFIQLNVGQRDGVRKNMVFSLERGNEYLGDVVVRVVEQGESVGVLERQQKPVQQGDLATTRGA